MNKSKITIQDIEQLGLKVSVIYYDDKPIAFVDEPSDNLRFILETAHMDDLEMLMMIDEDNDREFDCKYHHMGLMPIFKWSYCPCCGAKLIKIQ